MAKPKRRFVLSLAISNQALIVNHGDLSDESLSGRVVKYKLVFKNLSSPSFISQVSSSL